MYCLPNEQLAHRLLNKGPELLKAPRLPDVDKYTGMEHGNNKSGNLTINVQQNNPDVRVECTLILSVLLRMTNPDDCDKYLLIGTWLYSGMRPEWKQMIGAGKRTLSTLSTCEVSYTLLVSRWVLSRFAAGQFCWYLPWPQFAKWTGILPQDLAKSRRFEFRLFQSLRNLTGTSAAALPRCLSNFRAIRAL